MIRLKKLGHIQLRVADLERSKVFYRDVLGFHVAEQDPKHGDLFMTLGEDFHTLDMAQHEGPETARSPARPLGVAHIAFQVASYEALGEAYRTLLQHGVRIERAMDHVNQRSIYFSDPDTNKLQITALGKENWSLISDEEKWQRTAENREKLGRGLSRFDRGVKPNE